MSGRLVAAETFNDITTPLVFGIAEIKQRTFPLSFQARPGSIWNVNSVTFSAAPKFLTSTTTYPVIRRTYTLFIGAQEFVVFSDIMPAQVAGGDGTFVIAQTTVSVSLDAMWTDTFRLEYVMENLTGSATAVDYRGGPATVKLLGGIT